MAESSTRVVYAALLGNVLVAVSKFVAAALSGSTAMLTEAIHSTADCANQCLMIIGSRRSTAPPDETHNFGYGPEIYFWTFVVAVLVLIAGGAASIGEGLLGLHAPSRLKSVSISLIVLAASAVFEGGSFLVGLKEAEKVKRRHPGRRVGFWKFIRLSKDPQLYETLLEDAAALVGIGFALAGVIGNGVFHWLWADGVASCFIGVLLIADALVTLGATRSLIAGESVVPTFLRDLGAAVSDLSPIVEKVETLHLGPECVIVTLTLEGGAAAATQAEVDILAGRIRQVDDRIEHVVIRA
jgi:cation diffusion facilitator family transporter